MMMTVEQPSPIDSDEANFRFEIDQSPLLSVKLRELVSKVYVYSGGLYYVADI